MSCYMLFICFVLYKGFYWLQGLQSARLLWYRISHPGKEYWVGRVFPSPEDLPETRLNPLFLHWQLEFFITGSHRKPTMLCSIILRSLIEQSALRHRIWELLVIWFTPPIYLIHKPWCLIFFSWCFAETSCIHALLYSFFPISFKELCHSGSS